MDLTAADFKGTTARMLLPEDPGESHGQETGNEPMRSVILHDHNHADTSKTVMDLSEFNASHSGFCESPMSTILPLHIPSRP